MSRSLARCPDLAFLQTAGSYSRRRSPLLQTRPPYPQRFPPIAQRRWQQTGGPAAGGANDYQLGPGNTMQPQPSTQNFETHEGEEGSGPKASGPTIGGARSGGDRGSAHGWNSGTARKMFESAATTGTSLLVLGLAGYGYHKYYKYLTLTKIDNAFNEGDPALSLATASRRDPKDLWVHLEEQGSIDRIIEGSEHGHYYVLIGEKGTGKTSMLLNAMNKTQGEACSMMEAHADPEIFRLRLGKALDFEFHEDYIGSLFSIHGPRETTALLDIERAFNKLEKVALRRRRATGKPLIMIINGMHMIRDDDIGNDLLELLQQRAESWAASGLVTVVFNSDDYWVYERLKRYGSRMELISVRDLTKPRALAALKVLRGTDPADEALFDKVYELVGGRLAFLTKVAKSPDMIGKCQEICQAEKTWLLNKCWILGEEMDDDVMDQQKFASSAMMLVKALVEMEKEQPRISESHQLPEVPLHKARQIMTRADFIQQYDHDNIFTIDYKGNVRADSVPMMNAFRDIVGEQGFVEFLEETMDRISDIESLGRTREVTLKDLWNGGKYSLKIKDGKGRVDKEVVFDVERGRKGIHGDEGDGKDEDDD